MQQSLGPILPMCREGRDTFAVLTVCVDLLLLFPLWPHQVLAFPYNYWSSAHWQGARTLIVGPIGLLLGCSCPVWIALKSELTGWQPDRSGAVVRTPVFLSAASMTLPANEWDQGQSWATFLSGSSIWLCMTEAGRTWTYGIFQDLPIRPLYAWESWGFTPHIIHNRCMNTSLGERASGTVWHLPSILTLALVRTWLTISSESKYAGLRVFRGSTFQSPLVMAPNPYRAG